MTRISTKTVSIQYCKRSTSQCNQQSKKKEKTYRLKRKKQHCHYSLLVLFTYQIEESQEKKQIQNNKEFSRDAGYEINIQTHRFSYNYSKESENTRIGRYHAIASKLHSV